LYKPKTIPTILGYTPVPDSRTLTINGTTYDLTANRAWTITTDASARSILRYVATASQTTFTISGGYMPGLTDVYRNGVKLDNTTDFTATNGTTIVLTNGAAVNDVIEVYKYQTAFLANNALRTVTEFVATAGQTTFSITYNSGLIDVFYNGSKLLSTEYAAGNGTTIVLNFPCNLNDTLEVHAYSYAVGAFTGQAQLNGTGLVRMSGTTVSYDNATYATQSYVTTAVANLVNSAPSTLDTLNELATALGNDANFATTITTSIGTKQPQLNGTGFVKISGTTVSYDNSTYLTTSSASSTYLPLTGGTLTGALSGTSATFSSSVQATNMSIGIAPQTDKLFVYNASGTNTGVTIQQDGTGDIFRANGNSGANRFSITQAGAATFSNSIGIATTSLAGNLSISTSAFSNAGTKSYTADNVGGISAYVSSQDPYRGYLDIYSTRSGDSGTLGGSIIRFLTSSTSTTVNAIQRMLISENGDVGIGNNSFSSTRLTITGKSTTSSDFSFVANNSANGNLFLVRNDGNVGIACNPNARLHNRGSFITDSVYYGEAKAFSFQSAFDNPTINIITINNTGSYGLTMIRVTVYQNGVAGSIPCNIHKGYAYFNGTGGSKGVSSMAIEASFNGGSAGIGTLSWSGTTLQYTSSRMTNYDGYTVIVEWGANRDNNAVPNYGGNLQ
jgi:hypothetical protein